MTRPESQPRHPLALLDLLIRVNAAAQNPGEEHENLAEQFTQVMADPATGEQLRALRAQAEAEVGLREALECCVHALQDNLKAWAYKNEPLMKEAFDKARAALAQAGGES